MNANEPPKIHSIKSMSSNIGLKKLSDKISFDSFIKDEFGSDGYCVCYMDYAVLIGRYEKETFFFHNNETIEPRYIQRMRLFNKDRELYLWRKDIDCFSARIRIDNEGNDTDVLDVSQVLWGTKAETSGDFTELSEDRGMKLFLPFKNIKFINNNKDDRTFIMTRNYISYDTDNETYFQAGYTDCRFIAFTDKKGYKLGGELNAKS